MALSTSGAEHACFSVRSPPLARLAWLGLCVCVCASRRAHAHIRPTRQTLTRTLGVTVAGDFSPVSPEDQWRSDFGRTTCLVRRCTWVPCVRCGRRAGCGKPLRCLSPTSARAARGLWAGVPALVLFLVHANEGELRGQSLVRVRGCPERAMSAYPQGEFSRARTRLLPLRWWLALERAEEAHAASTRWSCVLVVSPILSRSGPEIK